MPRKALPKENRPLKRSELFTRAEKSYRIYEKAYLAEVALAQAHWAAAKNPFLAWAWWMTSKQRKHRAEVLATWRQAQAFFAIAEKKHGPRK